MLVYNKVDLIPEDELQEKQNPGKMKSIFISAEKRINIDGLRKALVLKIKKAHVQIFPNWLEPEVLSGFTEK